MYDSQTAYLKTKVNILDIQLKPGHRLISYCYFYLLSREAKEFLSLSAEKQAATVEKYAPSEPETEEEIG